MRRVWGIPQAWEVSRECGDLVSLCNAELLVVLLSAPFEFFLCLLKSTQLVVPLRLQDIGHQAIAGIDRHEPTASQVSVVARPFDLLAAQAIGFEDACIEFGMNLQGHLDGHWRDRLEEQLADGSIDLHAWDHLAFAGRGIDRLALADILRRLPAVAKVIADRHPPTTHPADHQALQQRGSLAWRALAPLDAMRVGVVAQLSEIGFVLLDGDVAGVSVCHEHGPLLAGRPDSARQYRRRGRGYGSDRSSRCQRSGIVQDL